MHDPLCDRTPSQKHVDAPPNLLPSCFKAFLEACGRSPLTFCGLSFGKGFHGIELELGSLSMLVLGPSKTNGTAVLTDSTTADCIGDH